MSGFSGESSVQMRPNVDSTSSCRPAAVTGFSSLSTRSISSATCSRERIVTNGRPCSDHSSASLIAAQNSRRVSRPMVKPMSPGLSPPAGTSERFT